MKVSFDFQDYVFDLLSKDEQILTLLGNPVGDKQLDQKIRREDQEPILLTTEQLDFIAFYFPNTTYTKNMLISKGFLYVDYYTAFRQNAADLSKRVKEILESNMEIEMGSEGQQSSGLEGIYKYRQIYTPLIAG